MAILPQNLRYRLIDAGLTRESVILRLLANSAFTRFGVNFYDQVKIVMFDCPIPKFQHLRKFVDRVDMQWWNGILP